MTYNTEWMWMDLERETESEPDKYKAAVACNILFHESEICRFICTEHVIYVLHSDWDSCFYHRNISVTQRSTSFPESILFFSYSSTSSSFKLGHIGL